MMKAALGQAVIRYGVGQLTFTVSYTYTDFYTYTESIQEFPMKSDNCYISCLIRNPLTMITVSTGSGSV